MPLSFFTLGRTLQERITEAFILLVRTFTTRAFLRARPAALV